MKHFNMVILFLSLFSALGFAMEEEGTQSTSPMGKIEYCSNNVKKCAYSNEELEPLKELIELFLSKKSDEITPDFLNKIETSCNEIRLNPANKVDPNKEHVDNLPKEEACYFENFLFSSLMCATTTSASIMHYYSPREDCLLNLFCNPDNMLDGMILLMYIGAPIFGVLTLKNLANYYHYYSYR